MGRLKMQKMVRLSLLVSGAAVLHVVESWLPNPFVFVLGPGAKLGLANVVTLVVVLAYGWREAFVAAVLRSFLGSLVAGTFLTFGFYMSLAGAITSALAMGLLRALLGNRISTIGLSIIGAVTHIVTQLTVAALAVSHFGLFVQLPWLLLFAIPTGYFVGVVGGLLYKAMPKDRFRKDGPDEI